MPEKIAVMSIDGKMPLLLTAAKMFLDKQDKFRRARLKAAIESCDQMIEHPSKEEPFAESLAAISKSFDRLIVSHKRLRISQNQLIAAAKEALAKDDQPSFDRLRQAIARAEEVARD